ncbi:MAG: ATP-binding protein [Fimbriimonas sp.]
MTVPPTPEIGLLQVPLPDLDQLSADDPAFACGVNVRKKLLEGGSTSDLAALCRDLGRFDEALDHGRQAMFVALKNASLDSACRILAIQVTILALKGDFAAASEAVRQIEVLSQDEEPLKRAFYHEAAATIHLRTVVQDLFDSAEERYLTALKLYEESGEIIGQIRCYVGAASAVSGMGRYMESLEYLDRGLKLSAETETWRYVNRLLLEAALALRDQGHRQRVKELFELAIRWSEFLGDEPTRIRGIHGLAYLYDFEADPSKPEDLHRSESMFFKAIDAAEAIGALPYALQARLDIVHLYKKFGMAEAVDKQRSIATEEAGRLSLSAAPRWFDHHADYRQWLDDLSSERYYRRLQEAIEGVSDPFLIFDHLPQTDGSYGDLLNEFRNSAANQLLALTQGTVRALGDLLSSPYIEGLKEPILIAVNDRVPYEDEVSVYGKWYSRRVVPAGAGAVLTLRDCTESRKLQETLEHAAESARQADRVKTEFLANMSHEVRTPINGVLGLARLLAGSELNEQQRTYVDGIISSGDVLLRVIGDVLDLSKIEAERLEFVPEPTIVRRLVTDVVNLYKGQALSKGVDISGSVDDDVPAVAVLDASRVRQVLGNLVGNGVKFTQAGSVKVTLSASEGLLQFVVRDTGSGISEKQLEAVFKPFRQISTRGRNEGGTGLGLTISKKLAELMGGTITVESQVGAGSRFTFRLPLEEAQYSPAVDEGSESAADLSGLRILLVEDNQVNILVASGLLTQLGCLVDTAENGVQAVELALQAPYDAVLMDIQLPVMDGLEATTAIRRQEAEGKRVPIIALTAGTLFEEREACFQAGVDDYLSKPFTVEGLVSTLSKWCRSAA